MYSGVSMNVINVFQEVVKGLSERGSIDYTMAIYGSCSESHFFLLLKAIRFWKSICIIEYYCVRYQNIEGSWKVLQIIPLSREERRKFCTKCPESGFSLNLIQLLRRDVCTQVTVYIRYFLSHWLVHVASLGTSLKPILTTFPRPYFVIIW